jgi:uncharacterized protein YodC (DUF2158 family)
MDFKAGDVVVLKSGGPKMTVEKIGPRNSTNPEEVVHCIWFENGHVNTDKFSFDILMPYTV